MKKYLFGLGLMSACAFTLCSCGDDENINKLSIVAPNGAPAVSVANIAKNKKKYYDVEVVNDATILKTELLSGEKDVVIAPINLGATVYNKQAQNYKLDSVVTWGNLYFATHTSSDTFSINDLAGKKAYLFAQGSINETIVTYCLNQKSVELSSKEFLGSTDETSTKLLSDKSAICLVAEPSLSITRGQDPSIKYFSVQDVYKEITGDDGFPQAGCFISNKALEEKPEEVEKFINDYKKSVSMCNTDTSKIAGYCEKLHYGRKSDLVDAIPKSNIRYVKGIDAKTEIEKMVLIDKSKFGGGSPNDEFYLV